MKNDALKCFKIEESKKKSETMEEAQEMKEKGVVQDWTVILEGFLCVFFIFVLFRCGARLDRDCRGLPALSCLSCRISPKHCQVASHFTSSGCSSDKNIIKTSQTPSPLQILT